MLLAAIDSLSLPPKALAGSIRSKGKAVSKATRNTSSRTSTADCATTNCPVWTSPLKSQKGLQKTEFVEVDGAIMRPRDPGHLLSTRPRAAHSEAYNGPSSIESVRASSAALRSARSLSSQTPNHTPTPTHGRKTPKQPRPKQWTPQTHRLSDLFTPTPFLLATIALIRRTAERMHRTVRADIEASLRFLQPRKCQDERAQSQTSPDLPH